MRSNRSLPALVSLRAFEAAARRLSFSLAGEELFVTQSAISHHIQRLEAELGVTLFERRTRAVALTPAGQAYYERVHAAFELLRQGTDEARAPAAARHTLKVGLLASFATRWLAPRLPGFASAHPDIDLQLLPAIGLADVAAGEVDVAIRYGRGTWPGLRARRLMPERLSVVCAPSLVAGRRRPRSPADLLRYPRWSRTRNCRSSGMPGPGNMTWTWAAPRPCICMTTTSWWKRRWPDRAWPWAGIA